ncbi:DUF4397 domain-containing protein [Halobacteriaceae archaeon GCM10025711]
MQPRRTLVVGVAMLLLVGYAGGFAVAQDETTTPDEDEATGNETRVRAAHLSPFLPAIDVSVEREPIAENLSFPQVSEYELVEPGESDFEIQLNSSGDEIFETETTLDEGTNYTVIAVATVTENDTIDFQPALLRDDFEVPDEDNASIRVVHASPDTPAVDVTVAGTNETVADNLTFREGSDYVTVPAGNVTLELREEAEDDSGEIVERFNTTLSGGTVSSAFAVGYLDPDDAPVDFPLSVGVTLDAGDETLVDGDETRGVNETDGANETMPIDETTAAG